MNKIYPKYHNNRIETGFSWSNFNTLEKCNFQL